MDSLGFLSLSITYSFFSTYMAVQVHEPAKSSPQRGYRVWEESNEIKKLFHNSFPAQRYQSTAPASGKSSISPALSLARLPGSGRSWTPRVYRKAARVTAANPTHSSEVPSASPAMHTGPSLGSLRNLLTLPETLGEHFGNLPIDLLLLRELSNVWSVAAVQTSVVVAENQICFSFFMQNNQAICQEGTLCLEVSKYFLFSQPTLSLYFTEHRFCLTGGEMEREKRKTRSEGEWVNILGSGQRDITGLLW